MPSQRKSRTLQEQGVPIPDTLKGPDTGNNRFATGERDTRARSPRPRAQASVTGRKFSGKITSPGSGSSLAVSGPGGGIGLLAAEFFTAIALLILLFFAKSSTSLPDRIMQTIKRGTLVCVAFIILSLVAGIGPNSNRIAKAFGALIVIAIILTTPIYGTDSSGNPTGVIVDVDNIIKNDWVPSATHDTTTPASSNPGNNSSATAGTPGSAIQTITQDGLSKIIHAAIGSPAYNAVAAELRAFKSGAVYKVPGDAVVALEDIGTHGVGKAASVLKSVLKFFGI